MPLSPAVSAETPVVLLHGATGNAATWGPLMDHWPGAVALDLPGRGAMPEPACTRVADTAAWLRDTLTEQGLGRPLLVGHSYGGAVALQLGLDHPDAVAGIAMVSSAARLRVAPVILEAVAAATDDVPFRLDAAFGPGTDPAVIEAYHQYAASVPAASARADWEACNAFDVRDRLGACAVPVAVVWGSADALTVPKYQRRLVEALPRATGTEIEGCGHMLPWEAPMATARRVLASMHAA